MVKCTNKGCGKEFDEEANSGDACSFHSGGPIFHEGLKSWGCCNDVNKPVLDFDDFMKIPGCTKGRHSSQAPKQSAPQTSTISTQPTASQPKVKPITTTSENGVETFKNEQLLMISQLSLNPTPSATPPPPVEDEDDVDVGVSPGAKCLRQGCGTEFLSQKESRIEGGEHSVCTYHPLPPIFHEGSKGYMCCKRRVLDFDDFLKIEGCKTGKHVFVKKALVGTSGQEFGEFVKCRIDHYQTPDKVHVSVYAKKADKDQSKITFAPDEIHLDLSLPQSKRFMQTLTLYDSINPDSSSFTFFGTKVDLLLDKASATSWPFLEKPSEATIANLPPGYGLTFGVGGRTGATTPVFDLDNKVKAEPK
ncbi:HSP20-like chaperone [Cantharellus anzutake]|uniref:HSP20-like chaperone n=1 Tax=Cantharellus anzutake TaxID=1750568 RepID=UPI0019042752|nr:HSP20-like chaperone [Cantharellus anzutake]KAF8332253.1 HSP20-like chaperone [Cantharellus anzutake]